MPFQNPYSMGGGVSSIGNAASSLIGGGDDTLDKRKKRLLDYLNMNGRGVGQFGGLRNRGFSTGGIGGRAPLPALSYNPFLSQVAGRPGEVFPDIPAGVTPGAVHAAQAGPPPVANGGPPPMVDSAPGVPSSGGGGAPRNMIPNQAPPIPGTTGAAAAIASPMPLVLTDPITGMPIVVGGPPGPQAPPDQIPRWGGPVAR